MLRICVFAVALLLIPAVVPTMAAKVDTSCKQVFEAAAARARVAVVRRNGIDGVQSEESCRAYTNQFFEAVKARQAAAICEDGLDTSGISSYSMPGLKLSTTWSHPSAAADAPNGAPCVTALRSVRGTIGGCRTY